MEFYKLILKSDIQDIPYKLFNNNIIETDVNTFINNTKLKIILLNDVYENDLIKDQYLKLKKIFVLYNVEKRILLMNKLNEDYSEIYKKLSIETEWVTTDVHFFDDINNYVIDNEELSEILNIDNEYIEDFNKIYLMRFNNDDNLYIIKFLKVTSDETLISSKKELMDINDWYTLDVIKSDHIIGLEDIDRFILSYFNDIGIRNELK
jgi:hypothetical protein